MRWKLLFLASLAAALIACGLWSALAIALFGTARGFARHDWLFFASASVPLGMAAYAGIFVYRHTARRRKTQAAFAVILSLFLTLGAYLVAVQLFPDRLIIRRTY